MNEYCSKTDIIVVILDGKKVVIKLKSLTVIFKLHRVRIITNHGF